MNLTLVDAKSETEVWAVQICFCIDTESGEKIPLTETAVMGEEGFPSCKTGLVKKLY